jgi:Spy/CpxP family protein refolding chaperone
MRWHRFAPEEQSRRMKMTRIVFAMVVAAMLTLAVSGTSQAAPIAPLSSAAVADQSNVTPVYWHHHRWYRHPWYRHHRWYRHGWYRHHRHCWRGRWGHVHCRWW